MPWAAGAASAAAWARWATCSEWAAACPDRRSWRSSRNRCRAACPAGCRGCRRIFQPEARPGFRGSAASCRVWAECPDWEKRNDEPTEGADMSLKIRLARAGTKKRPYYHVVIADSRAPRDGRVIERLGDFNPLPSKGKSERLKLYPEKVKGWHAQGARPTDRRRHCPHAAGVMRRPQRKHPS